MVGRNERYEILIRQYEVTIAVLIRDRHVCENENLTPTDIDIVKKIVPGLVKCELMEQGYYDLELWDNLEEFDVDAVILVA